MDRRIMICLGAWGQVNGAGMSDDFDAHIEQDVSGINVVRLGPVKS
jgi:hypothetical protein